MDQDVVILRPPVSSEGIDILINNRPFTCPMAVKKGGQVRLSYKRDGLDGRPIGSTTMYTQFTAIQNTTCELPQLEWYKLVSYAMIVVKGQDGQDIPYSLWINNKAVAKGYGVYLRETELNQVAIRVESDGWNAHEQTHNLHITPIQITLYSAYEEQRDEKIEKKHIENSEPEIETKEDSKESSVDTRASKESRSFVLQMILTGIICFALGLGLGWRLFAPQVATTIHSSSTSTSTQNTDSRI